MNTTLKDFTAAQEHQQPILFSGGAIVTMNPTSPDLETGDLLIKGRQIIAIGEDLRAEAVYADLLQAALVVDTHGMILSPGFVDTHRHAWQSQLRRTIPDVNDLGSYVNSTLAEIAPHYTAEDMYIGTHLAALSALDCGITTMLDFSHNSRTSTHSDQAIQALIDSGIRGVHASMGPHFGAWDGQWPSDLGRLVEEFHGSSNGLVTVRLAALATADVAGPDLAYKPELWQIAKDLGIGISIDAVFGQSSSTAIHHWEHQNILDSTVTMIHATGLTPQAWEVLGRTGTRISLAPTSDAQIGLETAIPAIDESLAVGIRPGLSIDVEVALSSDMFTQMRALLAIQRMRASNNAYPEVLENGRLTTRDVLDFATLQGASSIGLDQITGSLAPGKEADLLLVRANDINNMPLNNAVGTLVLGADPRNIEAVLVAGQVRKWAGQLVGVDLDALRKETSDSRNSILNRGAKNEQ